MPAIHPNDDKGTDAPPEIDRAVGALGVGEWYVPELPRGPGKHFQGEMYSIDQPAPRPGFVPMLVLWVSFQNFRISELRVCNSTLPESKVAEISECHSMLAFAMQGRAAERNRSDPYSSTPPPS